MTITDMETPPATETAIMKAVRRYQLARIRYNHMRDKWLDADRKLKTAEERNPDSRLTAHLHNRMEFLFTQASAASKREHDLYKAMMAAIIPDKE
jgi:hypothetical protein